MNPFRSEAVIDYEDELVAVIRHDARTLPLEDESVDLIVTSPPFWALRSYRDDGAHYDGQIGSEGTPAEFLDALDECMAEWDRVLKPTGSCFVELGDKYAGSGGHNNSSLAPARTGDSATQRHNKEAPRASRRNAPDRYNQESDGIRAKSLLGLPWRFANHQIDAGWILRAEIIGSQPNGLPESVTDRVRRSHRTWFHFVKEPRYFSGVDEIREPQKTLGERHEGSSGWNGANGTEAARGFDHRELSPLGRLPGSVWTIPSEPLLIPDDTRQALDLPDHFAAFPQEFPRRIILGWSPTGICTKCDQGRRPIVEVQPQEELNGTPVETRRREPSQSDTEAIAAFIRDHREAAGLTRAEVDAACETNTAASWWEGRKRVIQLPSPTIWRRLAEVLTLPDIWDHLMLDTYMRPTGQLTSGDAALSGRHQTSGSTGLRSSSIITGYACACPTPDAPTTPSLIVDPFGGTGTVAGVAKTLGRYGISNDLSASYNRLAVWRITQSGHFTKTEQRSWADRQGQLL